VRWILACALLIPSVSEAAQPPSQAAPAFAFDLATFAAELDRLAASLEYASEAEAVRLRAGLPDRWHVESGTDRFDVSTGWLARLLPAEEGTTSDWATRRRRARSRLLVLSGEARALAGGRSGRPVAAARTALEQVLQRREFQQSAAAIWRQRVEQKIRELLSALGDSLGLSPRSGRLTAVALAWVAGLAALGGLIVWLTRALTHQNRSSRLVPGSISGRRLSARDWAQRCATAMDGADVKEAVRCAYNACLRRLEEQGVWRIDPARTAREYLRLLPPRHEGRDIVTDLTRLFERAWYGNQPLSSDDANRLTAHLESLGCLPARERAI
jgi:hypothetical protein